MIVKIYATLWALIGVTALVILAAGMFNLTVAVAFGFVCFGMVFMGMMGVLPATYAAHHKPSDHIVRVRETSRQEATVLGANGLAVR